MNKKLCKQLSKKQNENVVKNLTAECWDNFLGCNICPFIERNDYIVAVRLKSIYFNWRYMNYNLKVKLSANFWIL